MTAQRVSIDEIWALAMQHAKSINRERENYLPEINENRKMMVDGMEVFFRIDNDPVISYGVGETSDTVYFNCPELQDWDEFEGASDDRIMRSKEELEERIRKIVEIELSDN